MARLPGADEPVAGALPLQGFGVEGLGEGINGFGKEVPLARVFGDGGVSRRAWGEVMMVQRD